MSNTFSGQQKELEDNANAFDFPMDTSKVFTKATITLGVIHYILRPDEWLILRNVDWFQNLISGLLGVWVVGFITIIIKLVIEHFEKEKINLLENSDLWITCVSFSIWLIGAFLYKNRSNQKFSSTRTDRQFLVDEIDNKLRLKFNKNK
jgi:hypothetical protein